MFSEMDKSNESTSQVSNELQSIVNVLLTIDHPCRVLIYKSKPFESSLKVCLITSILSIKI